MNRFSEEAGATVVVVQPQVCTVSNCLTQQVTLVQRYTTHQGTGYRAQC